MITGFFWLALVGYALSSLGYLLYLYLNERRVLFFARIAVGFGLVFHTGSLAVNIWRWGLGGFVGVANAKSIFAWLLVLGLFAIGYRVKIQILGALIAPAAFLMCLASLGFAHQPPVPIEPLRSPLFPLHILGAFSGEVLFTLTALLAILYLLQERQLKSRRPGFLLQRIPPLQTLDHLMDQFLKIGFFCLTLGILAGAIWAHLAMRSQWVLDPKQLWAMVTWVLYASILYLRAQHGLIGRKGAIFAIFGFVVVFFMFMGVNLIDAESHRFWVGNRP